MNFTLPLPPLLLAMLLASNPLWALPRHYEAPEAAVTWEATSGKQSCALEHRIPHYGLARFEQAAGHELSFSLNTQRQATREGDQARLRSLPSKWMLQQPALDLGAVTVHRGNTPVRLNAALSRRLLAELEKGMYPTFSYRDWADAQYLVSVALPGINIRSPLDQFQTCLAALPVYDFADFQDSLIHFGSAKSDLDADAKRRLDALIEYLKTDPAVSAIHIDGHTDDVGRFRANDKLGARRAGAIKDYLLAHGIAAQKIQLKSYGERQPVYTNTTDEGRARNRRARVTLIKGTEITTANISATLK